MTQATFLALAYLLSAFQETPSPSEKTFWGDLPTWLLAIIGGVAAWIALATLRDIRDQTKNTKVAAQAAKESATTALLSVQAVITAERARVEVDLVEATTYIDPLTGDEYVGTDPNDYGRFAIEITNHGRTIAQIISFKISYKSSALKDFDPAQMGNIPLTKRHMILAAGKPAILENFTFPDRFSDAEWKGIQDHVTSGLARIDVLYDDIISGETYGIPSEPHRTTAIFTWDTDHEVLIRLPRYNVYS